MADLQNISFNAAASQNVQRIRIRFEYSTDNGKNWTTFQYFIPDDMFSIRVDDREQIAIQLIRAIAIGKGHMDEDGNILV